MARVKFRAHGKLVSFTTRPRRKGRVPKHLKPFLFKPKRSSRGRKGKTPPQLKPFLFKPGHRRIKRSW